MPIIADQVGLTLDNISFATDFSRPSDVAATYAHAAAKRFSSVVTIVSVVDLSLSARADGAVIGVPADELRHRSGDNVDRLSSEWTLEGLKVKTHVPESHDRAKAIVELAKKEGTDLIVLGTHARRGFERAIEGSVAEGVIRQSECPVLTIGPNVKKLCGPLVFDNILFATDLQGDVARQARVAFSFAQEGKGKIYLCHTMRPDGSSISETLTLLLQVESALEKLIPPAAYERCSTECWVEQGEVAPHLLSMARKTGADLIVLGARRGTWFSTHLLAGVVGHVLSETECPVLTILSGGKDHP